MAGSLEGIRRETSSTPGAVEVWDTLLEGLRRLTAGERACLEAALVGDGRPDGYSQRVLYSARVAMARFFREQGEGPRPRVRLSVRPNRYRRPRKHGPSTLTGGES